MPSRTSVIIGIALAALAAAPAGIEFKDPFKVNLAEGWRWVREDPAAWRMTKDALEVRVQPGNMWGPANNAHNLLVRDAPDPAKGTVDFSVTVKNEPKEQWEQADLVWYYDDSNMVKCGQELVDGQLSIVMGREQNDKTRTIKIVPLDSTTVSLRLIVKDNRIHGQFKKPNTDWQEVGDCDLPVKGDPKICLMFYQGPPKDERWVKVTDFNLTQKP